MKRENIRTYCYYSAVIVLSAGAYYWFSNLGDSIVKALLDFYKMIVEIFLSNNHYYIEGLGYYAGNSYKIGKECLGLGIIVLIFGCCGILSVKMLRGYKRMLGIAISAPAAIITGIFANILRLISSIYFVTFARFELIHALLGIVIYLCVLFAYYRLFIWLNNRSPIIAGVAGVAGKIEGGGAQDIEADDISDIEADDISDIEADDISDIDDDDILDIVDDDNPDIKDDDNPEADTGSESAEDIKIE